MINSPKILLIGPLPKPTLNKIGGARVSFKELVDYLTELEYPFQLVETRPYELGWKKVLNPFLLLWHFIRYIGQVEVVWLNVSQGGSRYLAPVLAMLTKMSGTRFVFRPFGSSLEEDYTAYSSLQKWWFTRTALQADLLFLQTQRLIDFFEPMAKHVQQLPTSRKEPSQVRNPKRKYQKRFVFLGHIKADKGIDEIMAAAQTLGDEYQVHLYGPIKESKYDWLQKEANPYYQGMLAQQEVLPRLSEYDVLLLPTYFSGEGYPGAIIEAYALGLPVIATKWRSIPEIVQHEQTGLLITPQSTDELVAAMQSFDSQNYPGYSARAQGHFQLNFAQKNVLRKALGEVRGERGEG